MVRNTVNQRELPKVGTSCAELASLSAAQPISRHVRYGPNLLGASNSTAVAKLRVAWPEKLLIVATLIVFLMGLFLWSLLAIGARSALNTRFNLYAIHWFLGIEATMVLQPWIGLRAIHLAIVALRRSIRPRSRWG
jgi:hypothetical protein